MTLHAQIELAYSIRRERNRLRPQFFLAHFNRHFENGLRRYTSFPTAAQNSLDVSYAGSLHDEAQAALAACACRSRCRNEIIPDLRQLACGLELPTIPSGWVFLQPKDEYVPSCRGHTFAILCFG